MRHAIALLLCATLATGCATAGGPRFVVAAQPQAGQPNRQLLAEYVAKLPIGSRVRVEMANDQRVTGTLMKATDALLVVQPRTRVPEPPVEISLDQVLAVELDPGGSVGKTFAIAIVAAAAGTLTVLLVLAAIWAD